MNAFLDTIRNLGVARLAAAAGMTIGLIVFFVFLATRLSTSQLALLFDDLNPEDSTRIVHQLESMGIPHELAANKRQIRVLDPLDGVAVMRRRRARAMKGRHPRIGRPLRDHELCRGPGNLTMAMGITLVENQVDLTGDRLFVEDRGLSLDEIVWGPRIGIAVGAEKPWRAWVQGHPAASGPKDVSAPA